MSHFYLFLDRFLLIFGYYLFFGYIFTYFSDMILPIFWIYFYLFFGYSFTYFLDIFLPIFQICFNKHVLHTCFCHIFGNYDTTMMHYTDQ